MSDLEPREYAPGDRLDERFLLIERIGRGGFGDVWRAEELLPDGAPLRTVALKLLQKTVQEAAHWAEEAKLLASFRHPSLVTIYAAGVLSKPEPIPFVAMELLEGRTLADVLSERKRVPWRRVVAWARAVAAALDVIHVRGVIHLDLKPANLFLTNDGTVKVLDFGISRRAGSQAPTVKRAVTSPPADAAVDTAMFVASHDTEPRAPDAAVDTAMFVAEQASHSGQTTTIPENLAYAIVGTPGFMAPEIFELAKPAPTADAYALAATVVKLATGHMPYEDVPDEPTDPSNQALVSTWWSDVRDATLRGKLRDLSADPARLPSGLVTLLNRLLAVDPLGRGVQTGRLAALFDDVWQRPYGVIDPPYLGLAPLPKQAEGLLFGRGDDVARLGRELVFEPAVVLHGPRGVGKSSLARAALVPYLAHEFADGKDDWIEVHVRPGTEPDRALDDALGQLHLSLVGAAFDALERYAKESRIGIVLLVDPLDEVLRAPTEASERLAAIFNALSDGAVRPGLRLLGVLGEANVLKFVSPDSRFASLRPALRFVGSPPVAAVQEIVTGPLRLAGAKLVGAETIVNEVQRELRGADDRLPLVALALRAFWETRTPGGEDGPSLVLNAERWRALGGVAGALAAHAHRVLAALDDDARAIAIEAMLRLARTDRKPIRWNESELASVVASESPSALAVFAILEREGLLRRRDGYTELSHPSLASLPRIEQARERDTERLVLLERLHEAAIAWDRAGLHPEFLLTGSFYDDVIRRSEWTRRSTSPLEKQFIEQSRRLARRRSLVRAAAISLCVAVVVAAFVAKRAVDIREAAAERARLQAAERAYVADVVARSKRVEDPYQRVAWIAEAVDRGSTDPALPLELLRAAADLPQATFLTLSPTSNPAFPWDERWLVANAGSSNLVVVDFHFDPFYQEPSPNGDAPAEPPSTELRAHTMIFRPHEAPVIERVFFAFDTAFATRSSTGELRVFRMRKDGSVSLAATAPAKCNGTVKVAEAAPVLVCPGENGLVRWDLRRASEVDTTPFQGTLLDISPNGEIIAASMGSKLLLWQPAQKKTTEVDSVRPVQIARFGPREPLLALVRASEFDIVDPAAPEKPLFSGQSVAGPTYVRWDEGGLDLAICGADIGHEGIVGRFHYLRKGARSATDPLPKGLPCEAPPDPKRPVAAKSRDDIRDWLGLPLRARDIEGGFAFAGGGFVTRNLVQLAGKRPAADSLVRFRGEMPPLEPTELSRAVSAVVRENKDVVAFQVASEIKFFRVDTGKPELTRKGNLLRRCDDGRIAAWLREDKKWRVFDARSGATIAEPTYEPGLVIGVDSACKNFYFQRLDGALVAASFGTEVATYKVMAQADGYVFDVRRSLGAGAEGPGLWLAVSSGALARIDENSSTVRVFGYATPRASALSDGPLPGQLVYADETGVYLLGNGKLDRLLESVGDTVWEDISVAPDGESMLLLSVDRVAALDIARRDIVGSTPLRLRTRFVPWDKDGSVLAWSFDSPGEATGDIIPRGRAITQKISHALSNLRVEQGRLKVMD